MQIKVACLKHCTRGNKWCATKSSGIKTNKRSARENRPMPDAPACRGRDGAGSGCGFGATRQVNYTKKKAGVVTATYYKKL